MLKNSTKTYLLIGLSLLIFSISYVYPVAASYNFLSGSGVQSAATTAGYDTTDQTTINDLIGEIIYAMLGVIALAFFGMIIYGGIMRMLARDNAEKTNKASDILVNSVIGLIVTLSAYAISYFVISFFYAPPK
jgi:hypothetical protein